MDHRSKLELQGVGIWVLKSPTGEVEFERYDDLPRTVSGNLWKFLEGGPKAKYVDPQHRFVLLDALDEVLRADATTGALKTVAALNQVKDRGLRHGKFISAPVPVFIFELGLVVFDSDDQVSWLRNDLKGDDFFERIENGRIFYSSEHRGKWAYDLSTGERTTLA